MAETRPKLVVLGGGGHAKVAIETLRDADLCDLVGFLDRESAGEQVLGLPRLGDDVEMATLRARGVTHVFPAVGSNAVRVKLAMAAKAHGLVLANAVSPFAYVSKTASLGEGVLVVVGAAVNADASIGDCAIVNTNASVDHDGRIGAGAHVAPRSALAGGVTVGEQVLVGIGSTVLPRVTIGANAIVGAGSCVVSDIPPGAKAYGVPARVIS